MNCCRIACICLALTVQSVVAAHAQKPFSLQQVLSAPYATSLTASPVEHSFAWVENAEGVHNLWIGGPHQQARALTHFTDDDGLDISGLVWSPDGKLLAYVRGAENGANGKPANPAHLQPEPAVQVWVIKLEGGEPPKVLGEGRSPLFSRDGSTVYFIHSGQIWARRLHDGERAESCATRDTADESQMVGHRGVCGEQEVFDRGSASQLTLSPDGTLLAFVSRRDHDHSFIGLFDLREKRLRFVAPSTGQDSAPAFSRDGRWLAWLRVPYTEPPEFAPNRVSATPWSIQVADVASGDAHTAFAPEANKAGSVLPHTATGEPRLFWTAEGRIVFFSEADGWLHLYAVHPESNKPAVLLTPGDFEVEDPAISTDGRFMVYASNQLPTDDPAFARSMAAGRADTTDTERRHLWRIDFAGRETNIPKRLTGGSGIEARPQIAGDDSVVAALVSDAHFPMHPALITPSERIEPLQREVAPARYPAGLLKAPEQVFFLSSDKLFKLHGQLFRTGNGTAKHPAILFFHGGPHREMLLGYPGMEYYSNAYAMNEYLASRGFIVLSVNYRCGIGYGMNFRQCEHAGADGASEYNDALGAAAFLRARTDVDVQHIGVWGGSYGGYFTALALARNSNLFASGVDFHGVHDWVHEDNRNDWLRGSNAERDRIAARAHASSPMADVDRWRSPVLLIHGDNDPNVAYKQTPLLADALRARGIHVEELIFPDEVHEFLLHSDWLRSYEAEANFFERTLTPAGEKTALPGPTR